MSKYKNYKRKLRWKSTMRKEGMSSHGLIPCPECGGDIQHHQRQPGQATPTWRCADCGKTWPDNEPTMAELLPNTPCPQCGHPMYFRDGASLGGMWPDGAWECSSGDYSHMLSPEQLVPDTYQDPDTGHSDLTLPEHWSNYNHPLGPDYGFNDCWRCGADLGGGMCGADRETGKAICMNCWGEQNPEGLPPHPNLGVEVPPIGHPLQNMEQHNDPESS